VGQPDGRDPAVRGSRSRPDLDWLLDESDAPNLVYTSYGREPAVEVIVNQDEAAGGAVLMDLANAIGYTAKVGACTTIDDSI
jgi:hypothetical protein